MRLQIDKLKQNKNLSDTEFKELLTSLTDAKNPQQTKQQEYLFSVARQVREAVYGKDIYIRGLIEISNICRNDCFYCGIRKSNAKLERYRLKPEEILSCAKEGYELGFRTFVLQGGEDLWFTRERVVSVIRSIKESFPDCAVTLSLGEWEKEDYRAFKEAGADRYLLRHETATDEHYRILHPDSMHLSKRKQCLFDLKELGYEVGAGMMIGSPGQRIQDIIKDFRFLQELKPHMIGIGPFLSHQDTPFAKEPNGSFNMTLIVLAILRIMFPESLLPATTALNTIKDDGRKRGLLAGANVLMPNLSPIDVRKKYQLYDNKLATGIESAQAIEQLKEEARAIGYPIVSGRGDSKVKKEN